MSPLGVFLPPPMRIFMKYYKCRPTLVTPLAEKALHPRHCRNAELDAGVESDVDCGDECVELGMPCPDLKASFTGWA